MPLSDHLTPGRRWTFVGGKGGVGKTTIAAALALELAERDGHATVVSTDPAHSLGDALGQRLYADLRPVEHVPGLQALEINAEYERKRFLERDGDAIAAILERGTYLDSGDVAELTGLTIPGMDELAALLRLSELETEVRGRIVVDTAPTGHTLRLLQLPEIALGWLAALDAMEAKHAAVATALAGAYRRDAASDFLIRLRAELDRFAHTLRDPDVTRFLLVTNPDPVVTAETGRYREELDRLGIASGGTVVNRSLSSPGGKEGAGQTAYVPRVAEGVDGIAGLRRVSALAVTVARPFRADRTNIASSSEVLAGDPYRPPLDRDLYLVGGKGGVGKSTVAACLGLLVSEARSGPVLLLSVDPAGSLGEVLDTAVAEVAAPLPDAPGLFTRQVDAEKAWDDFRSRYRDEVEALFSGGTGGFSADLDRRVIERLVDLAPPGIDELMALMEVVDALEDGTYSALVVDSAPTGHFLRLLQMPGMALEWCHTLLRLLLKYREVTGLGGLAERVLKLARTIRSLSALLTDPDRSWTAVVALPESLSVSETARLLPALRELRITPGALLVNRSLVESGAVRSDAAAMVRELLRIDPRVVAVGTPTLAKGPVGPVALSAFAAGWRTLSVVASV